MAEVVVYLPSKHEDNLTSNASTTGQKKEI
jgi:hypothetical protein